MKKSSDISSSILGVVIHTVIFSLILLIFEQIHKPLVDILGDLIVVVVILGVYWHLTKNVFWDIIFSIETFIAVVLAVLIRYWDSIAFHIFGIV